MHVQDILLEGLLWWMHKFQAGLSIAGKPGAMEIAHRLNAYHVRLRTINRRMMAAVSELALTQATGIKLKEEKGSAEDALRAATRRMEVGLDCGIRYARLSAVWPSCRHGPLFATMRKLSCVSTASSVAPLWTRSRCMIQLDMLLSTCSQFTFLHQVSFLELRF